MSDGIKVDCPKCQVPLGHLIRFRDAVYLDTGSWLIEAGRKHCHGCGELFIMRQDLDVSKMLNRGSKRVRGRSKV